MNNLNEKMERDNNRIFSCGKIGIDCEWCINKVKCLTKEFYKNELNKSNFIDGKINEYANNLYLLLSNKINDKNDFTIAKLFSDKDKNYISINVITECFPKLYKIDKDGKVIFVNGSYEIFNITKDLLKDEFDFSEILFSYKNVNIGMNKNVKIFLYFIP